LGCKDFWYGNDLAMEGRRLLACLVTHAWVAQQPASSFNACGTAEILIIDDIGEPVVSITITSAIHVRLVVREVIPSDSQSAMKPTLMETAGILAIDFV
jgi:hypothetical protein